jgi:hypothetical protein
MDFTNKKIRLQPIFINATQFPCDNTAKCLGMAPDAKLRRKEHIKKRSDEFNTKVKKMYLLLGRNSELSVHKKSYYTSKL